MSDGCKCFACGNDAPIESYRCSTIGAATLNYCRSCAIMRAEAESVVKELIGDPEQAADWVLVYDPSTDWYLYYHDRQPHPTITTTTAPPKKFNTRKDFNEFLDALPR